jgi:hypothetical protein
MHRVALNKLKLIAPKQLYSDNTYSKLLQNYAGQVTRLYSILSKGKLMKKLLFIIQQSLIFFKFLGQVFGDILIVNFVVQYNEILIFSTAKITRERVLNKMLQKEFQIGNGGEAKIDFE